MTTGSATPSQVTRLPIGSLPLQPAGLLNSPHEPLSGNLGLWVTPHTSLQLRGRTAEFPQSRFTGQVMCSTRHTVTSSDVIFLSVPSIRPISSIIGKKVKAIEFIKMNDRTSITYYPNFRLNHDHGGPNPRRHE